jgi:hypothetical protein
MPSFLEKAKRFNGGRSSAVESWIVIPVVAGSNPVGRPNKCKCFNDFAESFACDFYPFLHRRLRKPLCCDVR